MRESPCGKEVALLDEGYFTTKMIRGQGLLAPLLIPQRHRRPRPARSHPYPESHSWMLTLDERRPSATHTLNQYRSTDI
jgi:hypothetical protein